MGLAGRLRTTHLNEAETECEITEVVADKGYHSEDRLNRSQNGIVKRTCIPEPKRRKPRKVQGKLAQKNKAYHRNKRNAKEKRGRKLQRLRSERSFAHPYETGGSHRTWLRGLEEVQKRSKTAAIALNLGRILRKLLGAGKPRHLSVLLERLCLTSFVMRWYETIIKARGSLENLSDPKKTPLANACCLRDVLWGNQQAVGLSLTKVVISASVSCFMSTGIIIFDLRSFARFPSRWLGRHRPPV